MEQQAPRGWKSPAAQVLHGKCELIETPLFFFFFFFPPPTTRYESHLREDESLCLQQHKLARRQTKKKKTSDQISAENVYRTCFPPLTSCSSHGAADAENPLQT